VERILGAIANPHPVTLPDSFFDPYREAKLLPRCQHILTDINHFFDHSERHPSDIPSLSPLRVAGLKAQRLWTKAWEKLGMSW
jgi:hypothetical protein